MTTEQPGRSRRRTGVIAGCVGLLLAGGATITWAATQQVGPPPAPPAAESTPASSEAATSSPSAMVSDAPTDQTQKPTPKQRDSTTKTLPASRPTAVRLPALQVSSPVHSLGLDAQGALKVPEGKRYDEVAWYDGSPTPGEVGPSVLEGHVSSVNGASVFFELGATKKGDKIEVDRADGTTAHFKVTHVRTYPKDKFPKVDVYGSTQGAELRVITCGGDYDKAAGHHEDNIVVYAKLIAK